MQALKPKRYSREFSKNNKQVKRFMTGYKANPPQSNSPTSKQPNRKSSPQAWEELRAQRLDKLRAEKGFSTEQMVSYQFPTSNYKSRRLEF